MWVNWKMYWLLKNNESGFGGFKNTWKYTSPYMVCELYLNKTVTKNKMAPLTKEKPAPTGVRKEKFTGHSKGKNLRLTSCK